MTRRGRAALGIFVTVFAGGCGKEAELMTPSNPPGTLVVASVTTGGAFDVDGYAVVVNGQTIDLDANAEVWLQTLADGTYSVELRGVASNCASSEGLTRSARVQSKTITRVQFDLVCKGPPELASVRILFARGVVAGSAMRAMNADGTASVTLGIGAAPDLSPDGTKIAFTRSYPPTSGSDLYVMSSDGSAVRLVAAGTYYSPDWSPDGRSLAVGTGEGWDGGTIQVIPAEGGTPRYLTGPRPVPEDGTPRWSPDGARVLFTRWSGLGGGATHVWIVNADGTGARQLSDSFGGFLGVWSPDGQRVAYRSYGPPTSTIVSAKPDGSTPETLLQRPTSFMVSDWSRDGSMLLLTGDHGAGIAFRRHIYLLRLADRTLWRLTAGVESESDPKFWETTAPR